MSLPNATFQRPACGACQGDTEAYDDDWFICHDCGLSFDGITLAASFTNPDTPVCGAACDNWWHGDHRIRPGQGFDCGTCELPSGHHSTFHWTGCQSISVEVLEGRGKQ